jgi:hypothetical protein
MWIFASPTDGWYIMTNELQSLWPCNSAEGAWDRDRVPYRREACVARRPGRWRLLSELGKNTTSWLMDCVICPSLEKGKVGVLLVLIVCMEAVLFKQMSEFRGVEEVRAGGRGASILGSAAQSRHTSWASLGKYLSPRTSRPRFTLLWFSHKRRIQPIITIKKLTHYRQLTFFLIVRQ